MKPPNKTTKAKPVTKKPTPNKDQHRARDAGKKKTANKPKSQVRYSDEVAEKIIVRMAGGESLRSICRETVFPAFPTVMRWITEKPEFAAAYQVAQDCRAQVIFDEILELADRPVMGTRVKILADGGKETTLCDQVERSKLQVHAREWILARMAPKRFGNRVLNEITGADGGPLEVAQPGRPAQDVADFSKQMFAAFQAFRDDDGTAAQLDAQAISSVSECVAGFASGQEGHYDDPAFLGGQFARIWCIRKKMMPPVG